MNNLLVNASPSEVGPADETFGNDSKYMVGAELKHKLNCILSDATADSKTWASVPLCNKDHSIISRYRESVKMSDHT